MEYMYLLMSYVNSTDEVMVKYGDLVSPNSTESLAFQGITLVK